MRTIERIVLFLLAVVVGLDHVRSARAAPDDRAYAANEFMLRSDSGVNVGWFRISREGLPELVLNDAEGRGRVVMSVGKGGDAVVGITDAKGFVRAGLLTDANGLYQVQIGDEKGVPRVVSRYAEGRPSLYLGSSKGTPLVSIELRAQDQPAVSITNEAKDARLEYGVLSDGLLRLVLLDSGAQPRVGLEIDAAGSSHLFAQDRAGKARADVEAQPDGAPILLLKDKVGKKIPVK